jgi:DNA-binding NarL/FixJ family response regulator
LNAGEVILAALKRCLLVGHHVLLLDGLRALLEPEFEVLSVATDIDAALALANAYCPAAAIIDLDAGIISLWIARRLQEALPKLAVTYLTGEIDSAWGVAAFGKSRPASELLQTVRRAWQHPANGSGQAQAEWEPARPAAVLSEREQQVLVRLVRGLSMKQVARELGIAPRTVAFHKYKAMGNNGIQNNAELMTFALRHRLLPVAEVDGNLASLSSLLPHRVLSQPVASWGGRHGRY